MVTLSKEINWLLSFLISLIIRYYDVIESASDRVATCPYWYDVVTSVKVKQSSTSAVKEKIYQGAIKNHNLTKNHIHCQTETNLKK